MRVAALTVPWPGEGEPAGTDPMPGCSSPNSWHEPGRSDMPKKLLLAALAANLLALPAQAQPADPALPPTGQTPPERVRPSADAPPRDQSLSDKLQQNDGVIKPPEAGVTGTVVTPSDSGSMPVIKPQELPGRAPGTEAK
jgi:hypothetical protein